MAKQTLTSKQQQFFDFLVQFVRQYDQWPSHQDFMDEFGFKSPRSVTQLYEALTKKKYLVKHDWGEYSFHPVHKYQLNEQQEDEEHSIPIVGHITAGKMEEAVEEDLGRITLESLLPNYQNMKALVVNGQSMKGDGIQDGDIVLYIPTEIQDGQIGAIRYQGETTLKRIYHISNGLKLVPSNDQHNPIFIKPGEFEEVTIIGRYIGHINEKGLHKVT